MASPTSRIILDLPLKVDVEEAKFMIFLSLFGKGVISSGKASQYLGMDRLSFLNKVSTYGMTMYSDDEESLEDVVDIQL